MSETLLEKAVRKRYEKEGWKTLRHGAPDFVFYKTKDRKIVDVFFVEVKRWGQKLKPTQRMFRKILQALRLKYKIEPLNPIKLPPLPLEPYSNKDLKLLHWVERWRIDEQLRVNGWAHATQPEHLYAIKGTI